LYSLAQRALGAPSAIIGSSIGQVYLQQASEEKIITGKVDKAFMSTLKKLILLSMLFFLPLFFVVEDLFAVMFGESWREAGIYAKILIPYFAVNFIVSALSVTDSVMEKQYLYTLFNTLLLVFLVAVIAIGFESITLLLAVASMGMVLIYFLYFLYLFFLVKF
jgi:O-antigen/teichoic acid export membrane protein